MGLKFFYIKTSLSLLGCASYIFVSVGPCWLFVVEVLCMFVGYKVGFISVVESHRPKQNIQTVRLLTAYWVVSKTRTIQFKNKIKFFDTLLTLLKKLTHMLY